MQEATLPRSRAELRAGSRIAARIAMMAITTRSSMRVKPYGFTPDILSKAVRLYSGYPE